MSGGRLRSKLAPGGNVALEDCDDFGFDHRLGNVVVHAGLDAALAVACMAFAVMATMTWRFPVLPRGGFPQWLRSRP
jgi:hypothetical protein